MKNLYLILCLLCTMSAYATDYYCDPATGSMSNPGTLASPWSTLQAVFAAGKTFSAGDVIYLMSGNHGFPVINKSNAAYVTITRYAGSDPVINRIDFSNASRWVIDNVKIFTTAAPPEAPVLQHPVYPKLNNTLVRVMSNSSYITFSNCSIYSIENNTAWTTADDWNNKAWNGLNITSGSHHVTINACTIRNVNFAIEMNSTENNIVQNSTIENFCGDGIRPGSYATIEYNTIKDVYLTNGNHYDLIQGFASTGIVIRGNILTNATANRAFLDYDCQGIGLFDGIFDNFVIENNLVILHHYHGISLYGARNCRIVNNTVVKNPVGSTNMMPWIGFFPHKDGTNGSGNIMSNNLVCDIESTNGATTSNNIITTAYTSHFINYAGFDLHLKNGSTAINAGTTTNAPTTDLEKKARTAPYDVGCYEYGSSTDVTAPSSPANLAVSNISGNGLTLTWTAATDNTGVTGYDVYQNNNLVTTVNTTTASITGLTPNTTYSFYVKARDAAGNISASSNTVSATTSNTGTCSGGPVDWTNTSLGGSQTGLFTIEFDAIAGANNMDGVIGLSNGSAAAYTDLVCIVRFNTNGVMDVRNGSSYAAATSFAYTSGTQYHVRITGNVGTHSYSVYVKPAGGTEVALATNYAFRTEQAGITQLTNRVVKTESSCIAISNFTVNGGLPTAIGDNPKEDKNSFRVYPNPVTDKTFSIDLGKGIERPTTIRIIDLNGKLVYSQSARRVNQVVPIHCQLTGGMYIVEITSGTATMSRKIFVK